MLKYFAPLLTILALQTGCSTWVVGARSPKPAVNVVGENLRLVLVLSDDVPEKTVLMDGRFQITEIHTTLKASFKSAFGTSAVESIDESNVILEISSFDLRREPIANIGATLSIRYKASLKATATGKVFRAAAGTAIPKNPMTNDWKRIYDDAYESLFEQIASKLFPEGVIPEIPEATEDQPPEKSKTYI